MYGSDPPLGVRTVYGEALLTGVVGHVVAMFASAALALVAVEGFLVVGDL